MENVNMLGNVKKIGDDSILIEYDTRVYGVHIMKAVAQYMIGKCHTMITISDEDHTKINVEITNDNDNIENVAWEFNEEVINYSFYNEMMESKSRVRELQLERVLLIARENCRDK